VGIRIGSLPDSSLRAIRVGQVRWIVCAAPAYLKRQGVPKSPADLAGHQIITTTAASAGQSWSFNDGKKPLGIKIRPRLMVNANDAALAAARDGLGLTRVISYQAASDIAAGRLKTVLSKYEEAPLPIHVIHHEGRHRSAKLRRFVELAVETLRADPALR
jgi:DNA-binding transcriptional LysR family regulator